MENRMFDLTGMTALVTGASGGIGCEIARSLARQGARLAPGDDEAARVQSCFALIATLGDTNLLHRGGAEGLAFAQWAARGFLEGGGVGRPGWRAAAAGIGADFVARRLSPGGSADLLAMSLFLRAMEAA